MSVRALLRRLLRREALQDEPDVVSVDVPTWVYITLPSGRTYELPLPEGSEIAILPSRDLELDGDVIYCEPPE